MIDTNKAQQASIYEKVFSTQRIDYDDFLLPPNDFIREKYFACFKPSKGSFVLEMGIGLSSFLSRAVNRFHIKAFGLDYVLTSLTAQKRNSPEELRLCRGDGEVLPYKNNSFDFIVAISVIEHLSDFNLAFGELWRVLKPGGRCLLQIPCKDFRYSLFARLKTFESLQNKKWFQANQNASGHFYARLPDRKEWRNFAIQNHFHVIFSHAADVFLDSWMMYYFFRWIKEMQSAVIRRKIKCGNDDENPAEHVNGSSRQESAEQCSRTYSLKRRMIGFIWYHLILRIFWLFLQIERLMKKLPVGAAIYLGIEKRPAS